MQRRHFLKPAGAVSIPDEMPRRAFAPRRPEALPGQYERYKTATIFDGIIHTPEYLG